MNIISKLISLLVFLAIIVLLVPDIYIRKNTEKYIINKNYENIKEMDCILVLGAGIWDNGPSPILKDRLDKAIELYKLGISKKIIMSGDHGTKEHDEVNTMKEYAIEKGVPSEDIFMDHAGFSTYDSMYRAKEIFGVKRMVIVSQKYHIYRSIYIAKSLGMNAVGVPAENIKYGGQRNREIREMLARDKDFFKCITKPKSEKLGKKISLNGSGDVTNDK